MILLDVIKSSSLRKYKLPKLKNSHSGDFPANRI